MRTSSDGDVRVSVRIPTVVPSVRLGRVSATSHFRPQGRMIRVGDARGQASVEVVAFLPLVC